MPYQPFGDLAPIVGAADFACVLQDPTHPVASYQMPAKVVDALAMGVPCLVTATPPLRPLVEAGVLQVHDPSDMPLHDRIATILDDPDAAYERAEKGRALFLEEYSYAAVSERIAPRFEQLMANPPELAPELETLVAAPRRLLAPSTTPQDHRPAQESVPARLPGSRRWRAGAG